MFAGVAVVLAWSVGGEPAGPPVLPPTPSVEVPPPDAAAPVEVPTPEPPAPVEVPRATVTAPTGGIEPLGIELQWRTSPECPPADRVLAAIGALVGRPVEIDPTAALVVRADVVADAGRWRIDLDVEGPGGSERRRLHAPTCDVLAEAAALVIATNVDAAAVARALDRDAPRSTAPVPRSRPDTARSGAGTRGKRRLGLALVVQGGPALGVAPKVTGWLQGGLDLSIGRAVIGVTAGHGFARRADGDATLRGSMTTGGLRGCFAPTQGRLAIPLCGIVELGAATARAEGDRDVRARALWAGAGAGAGVQWSPHPRVALVGGVDALVSITRPDFHTDGPDGTSADYRVAPAVVRATLGLAVRLR